MKIEWKKVKDHKPDKHFIWLSREGDVWLREVTLHDAWRNADSELLWAEAVIEQPEPPKKDKHFCRDIETKNFSCFEREGELIIGCGVVNNNYRELPANFCPFCGFTLEDK